MSTLWHSGRTSRALAIAMAALAVLGFAAPRPALAVAPANDNFANATVILNLSAPFSDTVDVTDATSEEPFEPQPCCCSTQTVWYAITLSSDAVLNAGAQGNSGPGIVGVYAQNGTGFGGLNFMFCGNFGNLFFTAKAGQTYFFQAKPVFATNEPLNFQVSVVSPPANDSFTSATPVTAIPFSATTDMTAATTEAGEPSPSCGQPTQGTAWFAFTPSASGSYVLSMPGSGFFPQFGIYTGSSLGTLTEVACRFGSFPPLLFHADAGTTYFIQLGNPFNDLGSVTISLDVPPPPTVEFFVRPSDPSIFDTAQFIAIPFDPAGGGFSTYQWDFGDGATATVTDSVTTHRYTADGDYIVKLMVTTLDGRIASAQQVLTVSTHDVTIAKLTVPNSAQTGQTRQISVGVTNARYPEMVRLDLYKNTADGSQFDLVGSLTQSVPVRGANRSTPFDFSYTFTAADAAVGKVTFKVVANLLSSRDALPADNNVVAPSTKVSK